MTDNATPTRDEAVPTGWRYSINYGPDGEENFANVYAADGQFVGNLRTHHAIAICNAFAVCEKLASAPSPASGGVDAVERLEDKIEGLEADLASAVEVAFRRGAAEWTRLNYPALYVRLNAASPYPAATPVSEGGNLTGHEAAARYGERGKHRHANLLADFDQSKRMLLACIEDRETRENVAELLMLAERHGADVNSEELAALRKSYTALDQLWREAALAKPASSPAGDVRSDLAKRLNALVAKPGRDWRTGDEFIHGVNSQDIVDIIREAAEALSQSTSPGRVE